MGPWESELERTLPSVKCHDLDGHGAATTAVTCHQWVPKPVSHRVLEDRLSCYFRDYTLILHPVPRGVEFTSHNKGPKGHHLLSTVTRGEQHTLTRGWPFLGVHLAFSHSEISRQTQPKGQKTWPQLLGFGNRISLFPGLALSLW